MKIQQRLDEITIAKALAITGVLLVHSSSSGLTTVDQNSIMFPIYNFLSTLGRLGTPTFIMLSSFILFYTYHERDITLKTIKSFYSKRVKYIVFPYVFFTLVFFFLRWQIFGHLQFSSIGEALEKLKFYLVYGKANAHLYFVIISIQFYLLFPFLLILFRKSNFVRKYAIIIGVLIQVLWIALNKEYFQVQFKGSVVFSYAAFYMLGAWVGIHYKDIKAKFNENKSCRDWTIGTMAVMAGMFYVFYVAYNYLVRVGLFDEIQKFMPYLTGSWAFEITWGGYAIFVSMVVLMAANYLNGVEGKFKNLLLKVGGISFGIYLVHPIYLALLRKTFVLDNWWIFNLQQLATFFVTYVLSYLTVKFVFRFIPFSWVIFGKK